MVHVSSCRTELAVLSPTLVLQASWVGLVLFHNPGVQREYSYEVSVLQNTDGDRKRQRLKIENKDSLLSNRIKS